MTPEERTPKGRRFLLFPGWVFSARDSDRHFVGTLELRRLYRLPDDAEWLSNGPNEMGLLGVIQESRDVLLGPRSDGNYSLADAIKRSDDARYIDKGGKVSRRVTRKRGRKGK